MQLDSINERRIALQLEAYEYLERFIAGGKLDHDDVISGAIAMTTAEFVNKMRKILHNAPESISTFDLMTAQLDALSACILDISKIQCNLKLLESTEGQSCN